MLLVLFTLSCLLLTVSCDYEANWDSLDSRPLPDWYDQAKIGIFLHWGVYSVPSYQSEWFWNIWAGGNEDVGNFMKQNYPPGFTYQDFASQFTAEFYNPSEWADLFKQSGAKYIVLTSKHHEGFTLWNSTYSYSWNAYEVGPHRNLLSDLADAVREVGLKFGTYYSLYEWFNPLYLADQKNEFKTSHYVDNKMLPELRELINTYKPEVLWSDGDWDAMDSYWKSTEFLAWLYNESPVKDTIVTNDRWGNGTRCTHGGYLSCDDRFNPGHLMPRKWEDAMTVDRQSWGYRRNMKISDIYSIEELIDEIVQTISFGGNILLNVGPTKEGTIIPIFQQRLKQLGKWLDINGEAIYETNVWTSQNDTMNTNVWYTCKNNATTVYGILLEWPHNNIVNLESITSLFDGNDIEITLLGDLNNNALEVTLDGDQVDILLPDKATVRSEWAWVLKIQT